ncbi:MAG: hypothetical protein CMM07_12975 [Rhodopirellula sp.]|nr:hypothetical protein [Rhodopirellula sp.]
MLLTMDEQFSLQTARASFLQNRAHVSFLQLGACAERLNPATLPNPATPRNVCIISPVSIDAALTNARKTISSSISAAVHERAPL